MTTEDAMLGCLVADICVKSHQLEPYSTLMSEFDLTDQTEYVCIAEFSIYVTDLRVYIPKGSQFIEYWKQRPTGGYWDVVRIEVAEVCE